MLRHTGLCALITLSICANPAAAKKIYKYQDEKGRWQFTDQAPASTHSVETLSLEASAPAKAASVVNRGTRHHPRLYAVNEYFAPLQVKVDIFERHNVRPYPAQVVTKVIPARGEAFMVGLRTPESKTWNYRYRAQYFLGAPGAKHAPAATYLPPFYAGASFRISQGFHGQKSHNRKPGSEYAVDIAMPVGTDILAARAGVVAAVNGDFNQGGYSDAYLNKANTVHILHDDGTLAVYAHLQFESVLVEPGQRVAQGQPIGKSGNTGFSSAPHLHFEVMQNAGQKNRTLLFEFVTPQSNFRQRPETGAQLTGVVPRPD